MMEAPAPAATDLLPEQPNTPEAATARIAELKKDQGFLERYLDGEVQARVEFTRLHGLATKGSNESGIHRSMQFDALRKLAPTLPEKCFEHVANNLAVAQFERDEALRTRAANMRDPVFVKRYLDGGVQESQLMTQISMILASPVKPPGE
jgi:hypothetical protein